MVGHKYGERETKYFPLTSRENRGVKTKWGVTILGDPNLFSSFNRSLEGIHQLTSFNFLAGILFFSDNK